MRGRRGFGSLWRRWKFGPSKRKEFRRNI